MKAKQQFTIQALTTDERHTVPTADWRDALEGQPEPCFLVVRRHDGRYAAYTAENDTFPITGEHIASDPAIAAASIRQHYATIR